MTLKLLASIGLVLGTISALLLLAGLAVAVACVAYGWLRLIAWAASPLPATRGRRAIRARGKRGDGLTVECGPGWLIVRGEVDEPGSWPRQWPIPGLREGLPGDGWSVRFDLDGRRGLAVAREVMAAGRGEAVEAS